MALLDEPSEIVPTVARGRMLITLTSGTSGCRSVAATYARSWHMSRRRPNARRIDGWELGRWVSIERLFLATASAPSANNGQAMSAAAIADHRPPDSARCGASRYGAVTPAQDSLVLGMRAAPMTRAVPRSSGCRRWWLVRSVVGSWLGGPADAWASVVVNRWPCWEGAPREGHHQVAFPRVDSPRMGTHPAVRCRALPLC